MPNLYGDEGLKLILFYFRMSPFSFVLEMKAYPDVQPALEALSATGIRLGFLSNLTKAMMAAKTEDPLRPFRG